MESRKLLSLGLKKKFGNDDDIDIWRDPWLIDKVPRGARLRQDVEPLILAQLKESNSDQWNLNILPCFLDEQECQRIMQVKPGGVGSSSNFSWIYNESGVYSVKSGYWLWSNSSLNQYLAPEQRPNFSAIYSKIWQLETSNKVKHFLWRSITSSLSVGSELRKKTITSDASCKLCGDDNEDANHLLFSCDLAQEVWALSTLTSLSQPSDSIEVNIWTCVTSSTEMGEEEKSWPWIMWGIWKARNEFIFQHKTTTASYIVAKARDDAEEWRTSQAPSPSQTAASQASTSHVHQGKWEPPPDTFLKCNVDAAWQDSHDVCGVAWIFRDSDGRVKLHGMKTFPRLSSALETEATALVWAVNCIWNMGYNRVCFETDSLNLIKALAQPLSWPRLQSYTSEIHDIIARRSWEVHFQHVDRKKNAAADMLAKHALLFQSYFGSIDNFVFSWLQPSLEL